MRSFTIATLSVLAVSSIAARDPYFGNLGDCNKSGCSDQQASESPSSPPSPPPPPSICAKAADHFLQLQGPLDETRAEMARGSFAYMCEQHVVSDTVARCVLKAADTAALDRCWPDDIRPMMRQVVPPISRSDP